ncbi:MAG: hypothetical protein U9N58_10630, partial [Thermodesulfobacteriota bacterium]|nr:hypothetical protein [Thermodesulfobacteriota bacterium]
LTTPESGIGHVTGQKYLALDHPSILSCNSGFGGINASIYMEAKPHKPISANLLEYRISNKEPQNVEGNERV